jgi:zinc transport system substrate-binding protein
VLKLVASNYPLAYFAERLAGTRAAVSLPVPEGIDPAFWRPDTSAIRAMQAADLIALNGADYEKWLPQVTLPRLKLVDTSAGFKHDFIRVEQAVTHTHGPGGEHSHSGTAFTTWLDLRQAAAQARALADAISRKRPEWNALLKENFAKLDSDLTALDSAVSAAVNAKPGLPLLASHPVYQYLARRYGLNLASVHWEPDAMPSLEEFTALRQTLATHPARSMLWEAAPKPEIAAKLQGLGVGSLVFSPCANRPDSGDFLTVMTGNLDRLKTAFR